MLDDAAGAGQKRQLWNLPTVTSSGYTAGCTPFTLPSLGVLSFANSAITLTTDVIFQPQCTGQSTNASAGEPQVAHLDDPFYASTTPQTYVIAATTVIAWVLLIMLMITPRTSFAGGFGGQTGFTAGHGIIAGAAGGSASMVGIGSRPWLQKVATLTVAISLTIATADTFKVAESQYNTGYMDASVLRDKVMGSLEIRVTRVISDVFLWLAQVQTLIRLFPRHKEKVLIKWIGFVLIICDTTFSCLNSFMVNSQNRPGHFVDAIPALSYLFELALGLLYAAWVIYYSLTKRRYAFYHPKMRNICVIALLSLTAVLTPVVFFVTDVSNPDVATWGDYFRWVGAAAASVVVWEWVERIEALEREEKKDGILGREIFDGDEMLDVTPSEEVVWGGNDGRKASKRHDEKDGDGGGGGVGGVGGGLVPTTALEHGLIGIANRFRARHTAPKRHFPLGRAHSETTNAANNLGAAVGSGAVKFARIPNRKGEQQHILGGPTPPPPVASPVSRTDTTSAASTMYVVHYDHVSDMPQPVRRRTGAAGGTNAAKAAPREQSRHPSATQDPEKEGYVEELPRPNEERKQKMSAQNLWATVPNPFKRKRTSPPAEVQKATGPKRATTPKHNFSRWDVTNRLGIIAAETGERIRDRTVGRRQESDDMPVTVVPAQPRGSGRMWSPDLHARHQAAAKGQPDTSPRTGASNETTGHDSGHSGSTTLTNNSAPQAATYAVPNSSGPPRADDISPLGAGGSDSPIVVPAPPRQRTGISQSQTPGSRADDIPSQAQSPGGTTVVSAPSRDIPSRLSASRKHSQISPPPRADDLSPPRTPGGLTIVPAPRRSPLHMTTSATSDDDPGEGLSDFADAGNGGHGAQPGSNG